MTEQYGQESINLGESIFINRSTPNNTPILITLGTLSVNGSSLFIFIEGGGSDPAAPNTNNYVTLMRGIFVRQGGTTSEGSQVIATTAVGAAVTLAFNVTGDNCELSITGPNSLYNHRLAVTASINF